MCLQNAVLQTLHCVAPALLCTYFADFFNPIIARTRCSVLICIALLNSMHGACVDC
jgi:hypothetical protein